ncbi:MAG: O-antigen ligase family protein [Victivallales bacterium]|nr:O-antigen ligase family protein [Victivallales bacterium]
MRLRSEEYPNPLTSPSGARRLFAVLLFLTAFSPLSLFAGEMTDNMRNFLDVSPENPFFPVLLLIGFVIALLSFLFPRIGLFVMLFFFMISTDMQLTDGVHSTGRSVSIRIEDIVLLLVSGGWLINRAKTRTLSQFRSVPVNKPIIAMVLMILAATIFGFLQGSLPFKRGVLFTLKRLEYFWFFFMTLNIMESDREVKLATISLIWLSALVAVVGVVMYVMMPVSALTGGGTTATSGFGRANTLADFFLIVGGVFVGMLIYSDTRRRTLFYLAISALCALVILMTKSRGAYVSVPPLLLTIVVVSKNRKTILTIGVAILLSLGYLLTIFVIDSAPASTLSSDASMLTQKHTGDIENQFESIKDVALEGPEVDSSFNARYRGWVDNIDEIFSHPIFGHGVGSVPLSYFDCQHVREMYETGLLGFCVFLYMNLSIFICVFTLFKATDDPFTKGMTCGFLGGHVGMMVHGVSIANFYTIMNMEVFWFVVALIMVLYHNHVTAHMENGDATI